MTEELKQIVKDEIIKLPEEMQKAINLSNWEKSSEEVGLKYLLTDIQTNRLQTEILLVLINAEYLSDLELNIENHLEISSESASNIGKELVKKIFTPISSKLKEEVKHNLPFKKTTWKQNINFIVSGGDYSAFIN